MNEYRGAMAPLSTSLDGDMDKAVLILERSIKSIEAYLATTAESAQEILGSPPALDSIAQKGDDTKEQQDEHANSDSPVDESN